MGSVGRSLDQCTEIFYCSEAVWARFEGCDGDGAVEIAISLADADSCERWADVSRPPAWRDAAVAQA